MKTNQTQKNILSDWQQVILGDICKVNQGLQIPISERFSTPGANGKLYITTQFLNGKSEAEYIRDYTDSVVCEKSDILMTRTGNSGVVVTGVEGVFHNNFFKVKPNKNVNSKLLIYNLVSPYIQYKLLKLAGTSTIPDLNHGDFYSIDLLLPPITEQNRIVSVLETWDKSIEKLSKKIEVKKQIKKGLMQDLLTGKKRLSGFSGKWNISKLAELEDLKIITLGRGEVISKTDIKNFPGENPIYSSSVHNNALFGKYSKNMFDEELISWSVDGGGHFFHRPKHKFSVTNVSGWMRVDTKILNYKFLASQLQLSHSKKYFDYQFKAHPSVIREEYLVHYPDIKEQNAIANILTIADKEITELEKKLSIIKEQKRYLLNNLINGIIRTPEKLSTKVTQ